MRCAKDFSCTVVVDGKCYIMYEFFLEESCLILDFRISASLRGERKVCVGGGCGWLWRSHGFRTCVLVPKERKVWGDCLATIGLVGGLVVTEIVNIDMWIYCRMTSPNSNGNSSLIPVVCML